MKLKYLLVALISSISLSAFSQVNDKDIAMENKLKGVTFYEGGTQIKLWQLVKIMQPNAEAHKLIKSASNYDVASRGLGLVAFGFIFWRLNLPERGEKPKVSPMVGAWGSIALAIPLHIKFVRQAQKAIDIYNTGLHTSHSKPKKEFGLCYTPSGIGISLKF